MARPTLTLLILLAALPVAAQVTATIEDVPQSEPADAFDITGVGSYNHDVLYKDDLYVAYWHGPGPSMRDDFFTWTWDPVTCTNFAAPEPGSSPECNDRVLMAWKHLTCADPNWACGANSYWNVFDGRKNYNTDPGLGASNANYFTWNPPPPIRRMVGWSEVAGSGYAPVSCTGVDDRQYTVSSYSGTGYPAVVYAHGRWFMAFDASLHSPANGGMTETDIHRIGWATSEDGAHWTYHGIIVRDASETFCSDGVYASDLYFENDTFYLLVTSITHGRGPGTNRLYLLKAPFSHVAADGTAGWYAPVGKDDDDHLIYTGSPNVSPAVPVDFRFRQAITDDSDFILNGTIGKVYASATSDEYRYVLIVDRSEALTSMGGRKVCPPASASYPLRVYTSDGLEKVFTAFSDITSEENRSRFQSSGWYGWSPDIAFVVPNDVQPRVYDPVTLFINYCASDDNRNNIGRVQLDLKGDIYQ